MKRWMTRSLSIVLGALILLQYVTTLTSQALTTINGDGLMVYGESGNTTPRWRTYGVGTNTFGAEAGAVSGTTPVRTITKTSPTKQEAIAGYVNASGMLQIMCYNGTSWTNDWSVSVGGNGTTQRFDIAYETATGDVMVVYSTASAVTNEMAYRTKAGANGCGAAQWSGATNINAVRTSGTVVSIRLEGSPVAGSNTIGLGWSDNGDDLSAMLWTDTSWSVAEPTAALESDIERVSAAGDVPSFDVVFESVTGNFMIAWGPSDALVACTIGINCVRYARYTTSWSSVTAVPTVADDATNLDLSANPNTNEIALGTLGNRQSDLSTAYWSGSAWTGLANRDTDSVAPIAGTKLVTSGWLTAGSTTRSFIAYADATAPTTNISYQVGDAASFAHGPDFVASPVPGAFRWLDIQVYLINKDRLTLTHSDANSDVFAKRLVLSSAPALTWTDADGGAALEASSTQATQSPFSFAYWRFIPLPDPAQGDGQIIYGEGTVTTPRNRPFYSATQQWGNEASLPTNTSTTYATQIRGSPTRNEMIAAVTNSSGVVTVYRWNGTSWSSEWSVTTGVNLTPRVSIAYEESSGDATVVYSTNTASTNEIAYRVWNGSSWTSATNFNAQRTSGVVGYVVAKARPGTDQIGMVWIDLNRDLSAAYWDGSAWTAEPASLLEGEIAQLDGGKRIEAPICDIAFEAQSGRLMVGWGDNVSSNFEYVLRSAGSGGSWGSVVVPSGFTQLAEITRLESRPGANDIAYITNSNWTYPSNSTNYKVQAAAWNGSSWTVSPALDANSAHIGEYDVGVTWLTNSGSTRAIFTYDKLNSSGIDYFTYNPAGGTFSASATYSTAPTSSNTDDGVHRLVRNPYNASEAMSIVVDDGDDLFAKKVSFDGGSLSWSGLDPAGVSMETNVSLPTNMTGWVADYDYRRYFPGSGSLTTDIVDSGGSSVSTPSLALSTTAASSDCQTTTGTFGVSAQKVRISNSTATPGWTMTMAATGGVTSNWSSGTANYDFNDSNGSQVGCGDGADADSLAGQLTVNPSASTITPQAGCSATGITAGSSSAFVQGTTDSVTLATASGSTQTNCYWDVTGIGLSQKIPSFTPAGNYSINVTVTTTAN